MEKIKVLLVKVGEEPKVVEIENTLEAKQKIVGGYIEMAQPPIHGDSAVIICNEEGKLMGLKPNRYLLDRNGVPYDVVCGDFIIVDAPFDSDDFGGLSDEQIEKYMALYG
jgi:hypothetical protein